MLAAFRRVTPLCPAGHLPHKGGDYTFMGVRHQSPTLQNERRAPCQPISPLVGEMAGRPEGGVSAAFPLKPGRL
ncbi:lytic murein transglycosylase [Phyllobacterium phragmitis]|uniref:Lytic murein transglycosylase n=1 Tax=Phyllobacterium phragmitis TaxID=2670329 RepID=A0A2S9IRX7_9HYPH|nr:lytic murein transglycosylase [Phyllobacterium phragmitis]